MEIVDVGNTYLADRLSAEGKIIQSALDHTYIYIYRERETERQRDRETERICTKQK